MKNRSVKKTKVGKRRTVLLIIISVLLLVWLNNTNVFYSKQRDYKLLAHRGLAQSYDVSKVDWDTNTAEIIDEPEHPYLENTIPSMQAAFNLSADVVELDVRLTKD